MLFDESIEERNKYENWIEELKIESHKSLKIKRTPTSGIGVFFRHNGLNAEEDIELLRVPYAATLDISNLKLLTNSLGNSSDQETIKKILGKYCSTIAESINETAIIIAYLLGYLVLEKKGKNPMKDYLDILMGTQVSNLHSDNKLVIEDFMSYFEGNALITSYCLELVDDKWDDFVTYIEDEFDVKLTTQEVFQLIAAIRSRTLEIPHGLADEKSKEEAEEAEEEAEEDYEVNVTLVPILDFVNHNNEKLNSYFDIDKANGDILLKLNKDCLNSDTESEFEVFISYSQQEDVSKFFMNYGFIPTCQTTKMLEIPMLGYFKSELIDNEKLNDRLYSLRQSPNVQLLVDYDSEHKISNVRCALDENYAYFIFSENVDWSKYLDTEESKPGTLDLNDYEKGYEKCFQIYQSLTEEEVLQAQEVFLQFIKEFFRKFVDKIDKFVEFVEEYELNEGETLNVKELLYFYKELAIKFNEQEEKDDILLYEDNEDILHLRLAPIYNFKSSLLEKEGVSFEELKL